MDDVISDEENFEYALRNFLQWVELMTLSPADLCNKWGNYNVAWELVSDLNIDGNAVVGSQCSYLNQDQKQAVRIFLTSLSNIPKSLLISATSASANFEAMSHSCWSPFRITAANLLKALESAAVQNQAYFSSL